MNWEAIGAVGEILGAIAVLVTLLYLATQVRQNTRAMDVATYESVIAGFNVLAMAAATDPTLARIFTHGLDAPETLSDDEALQFSFLMRALCNQWMKLLRLRESGALSDSDWQAFGQEASQVLGGPGGATFRAQNRVFADLYSEIDKFSSEGVTQWRLERQEQPASDDGDQ